MTPDHLSIHEVFDHQRQDLLFYILERDASLEKVMVVLRSRDDVHALTNELHAAGITAGSIHGNKKAELRDRVLKEFAEGGSRVLVITDASARNVDLGLAAHVVQFDPAELDADYVQRAEAVAKVGGKAICFVSSKDSKLLARLESLVGGELQKVMVENFSYDAAAIKVRPTRHKTPRRGGRSKPLQNKKPKLRPKHKR